MSTPAAGVAVMSELTLSRVELHRITGYRQQAKQLAELHRQGFYRARRSRTSGAVILERGHYDAIIAARSSPAPPEETPQLRPRLRAVL